MRDCLGLDLEPFAAPSLLAAPGSGSRDTTDRRLCAVDFRSFLLPSHFRSSHYSLLMAQANALQVTVQLLYNLIYRENNYSDGNEMHYTSNQLASGFNDSCLCQRSI